MSRRGSKDRLRDDGNSESANDVHDIDDTPFYVHYRPFYDMYFDLYYLLKQLATRDDLLIIERKYWLAAVSSVGKSIKRTVSTFGKGERDIIFKVVGAIESQIQYVLSVFNQQTSKQGSHAFAIQKRVAALYEFLIIFIRMMKGLSDPSFAIHDIYHLFSAGDTVIADIWDKKTSTYTPIVENNFCAIDCFPVNMYRSLSDQYVTRSAKDKNDKSVKFTTKVENFIGANGAAKIQNEQLFERFFDELTNWRILFMSVITNGNLVDKFYFFISNYMDDDAVGQFLQPSPIDITTYSGDFHSPVNYLIDSVDYEAILLDSVKISKSKSPLPTNGPLISLQDPKNKYVLFHPNPLVLSNSHPSQINKYIKNTVLRNVLYPMMDVIRLYGNKNKDPTVLQSIEERFKLADQIWKKVLEQEPSHAVSQKLFWPPANPSHQAKFGWVQLADLGQSPRDANKPLSSEECLRSIARSVKTLSEKGQGHESLLNNPRGI